MSTSQAAWLQAAVTHPIPFVSWARRDSPYRHLDVNTTHGVCSGSSLNLSQVGSMVLSPHHGMSRDTKRHLQRGNHTNSRWHEGESRDLVHLQLTFRNPPNMVLRVMGDGFQQNKAGTGTTQHNIQICYGSSWCLGNLIQFFTVTLKSIILIICFILLYEQQIESEI